MALLLDVKRAGAPANRIFADHTDGGTTYHRDPLLGTYWIKDQQELWFMRVPANVEYVAVRLPFGSQPPTYLYEPHLMGLKHRWIPITACSGVYPGRYHAPVMATCGPQGGVLLGCTSVGNQTLGKITIVNSVQSVELAATATHLELRFPKPMTGTKASFCHAFVPAATTDVAALLDMFLSAWGGPSEPSRELEAESLAIDIQTQDIPDDQLLATVRRIVDLHRGLAGSYVMWGLQNDPQRRCCEPVIEWREAVKPMMAELTEGDVPVLPYTRPDGADLADWVMQNRVRNCYAEYVDHVASCSPEQIARVAKLAAGIAEWPTLALPGFAFLASGCIHGSAGSQTWPDMTPRPANPEVSTWPEMGRRLFPRSKFFLGCQNGLDASWWGLGVDPAEPKRFAHATERWAFRLGMGLIPRPQPYPDGRKWGLNACTDAIMGEWYRSRFWHRRPYYRGVVVNEPGLYASRFTDGNGKTLLCVDRWDDASMERELMVDGAKVALPTNKRIAIVEAL